MSDTEKVEITLRGDAYRILPGETYVVETDDPQPADQLRRVKAAFEEATGAKCFVMSGARITKAGTR